jgi:hypothetical protein
MCLYTLRNRKANHIPRKAVRTYSRQTKRSLFQDEPPTKRRRVERTPESTGGVEVATTSAPESPVKANPSAHESSAPPPSSPGESPAVFSDALPHSSPPSSPAIHSSPPPVQRRRTTFSLFKKKSKPGPPTDALTERNNNANNPPPAQKKKRMVQMQLDLVGQHRKACKTCGMEYIPSNAEDAALHRKFHAMNFGGVDFTKSVTDRMRQKQVWSGGDGSFVAVVGRRDTLALRNRASDVLKVVNTELAAVPISDEELWSQTVPISTSTAPSDAEKEAPALGDRYKVYLYVLGQKCVGVCLAERIQEAYAVLDQDDTFEQTITLPMETQSSSISISTTADPAMLGISRIWTSKQSRKRGLAKRLLESARSDFLYGLTVEKEMVAFSQPTESGGKLARKWFGCQAGWHVYID